MKAGEIASKLDGELTGDPDSEITGISDYKSVSENQLTFLDDSADSATLHSKPAGCCVIVSKSIDLTEADHNCVLVQVSNPKYSFARIAHVFRAPLKTGISETVNIGKNSVVRAEHIGSNVSIGDNVDIGESCRLHDGVVVGDNCTIGSGTEIYPNSTIYDNTQIGSECILHAGVVIGADGFGYVRDADDIAAFPQIGNVVIGNWVEIGANSCIDRGALGATTIGDQTKIDNLVQVAHNVSIGKRVLIAAHVGISGSVVIEDDVVIGGQVGIADHVTIKKGAVLGARSAVFPGKIVRAGVWAGTPVQPIRDYKKQNVLMRSLWKLKKEIEEIKKTLK